MKLEQETYLAGINHSTRFIPCSRRFDLRLVPQWRKEDGRTVANGARSESSDLRGCRGSAWGSGNLVCQRLSYG